MPLRIGDSLIESVNSFKFLGTTVSADLSWEENTHCILAKARQNEIDRVRDIHLYDKVRRAEAKQRGATFITVRWVDPDKGDQNSFNVRSRLVARELKAETKEALLAL